MKKSQTGSAHLVIIVLIVVAVIGFVAFQVLNKQKDQNASTDTSKKGSTTEDLKPALQNLGMTSLSSAPVTNEALRDYNSQGLKGFYIFGDKLGTTGRKNPNFEFSSLKPNTPIVAAIDGVIVFIKEQTDSKDAEVFLQTKDGSAWMIGYDHLVDLKVKKGDNVKVGDVLGSAAVQGNGFARYEIQINYEKDGQTVHYCPTSLLEAGRKQAIQAEIMAFQASWEKVSGKNLYNQEAQATTPGCLSETMTPKDAEG